MRDSELIERVTSIPYDDFVRAYYLLARSPDDVPGALDEMVEHFRANPNDDFVMGPNFLSVLALFSEPGREMATSAMPLEEIRRRQRELAKEHPRLLEEFPDVLRSDS